MPTREEMIRDLQAADASNQRPSREQMIAELQSVSAPQESGLLRSLGEGALDTVSTVGKVQDTYTGAPTRAAIGALQEGENPLSAFASQFGSDPELAPTGKQIAQKAGLPDTALSEVIPSIYNETGKGWKLQKGGFLDPTASGSAGLGIDFLADYTNLIPGGIISKIGKLIKGTKSIEEGAQIAKTIDRATKSTENVKSVPRYMASQLTGIPEKEISTYFKHMPEVESVVTKHGEDIQGAVDEARKSINTSLNAKRMELNGNIGKALQEKGADIVSVNPVVDRLTEFKGKLNKTFNADEITQIDDEIARLKSVADESGNALLSDAFAAQKYFQEMGKGAYRKAGQIITPSDMSQKAFVAAGAEMRKIVNKAAPEIADANNTFASIHNLQRKMNRNLLKEGESANSFLSVGSNVNKNTKALEQLGKIAGKDFIKEAEIIKAADTFGNAKMLPVDTTGKSLTRLATGSAGGAMLGGPIGGLLGAAATSPFALKQALKGVKGAENIAEKLGAAGLITKSGELTKKGKGLIPLTKVPQSLAPQSYEEEK